MPMPGSLKSMNHRVGRNSNPVSAVTVVAFPRQSLYVLFTTLRAKALDSRLRGNDGGNACMYSELLYVL